MEENQATVQPVLKEPDVPIYVLRKRFEDAILYTIENSGLHLSTVGDIMNKFANQINTINGDETVKAVKAYDKAMDDYRAAVQAVQEQGGNL